jgi:uncharacterized protein (DUF58 family)
MPLFLGRVLIGGGHTLFPFVDNMGESTAYIPFSFETRGVHRLEPVHLESRFPFSFFVRATKLKASQSVIVFPEPRACGPEKVWGEVKGAYGRFSGHGFSDTSELASIRAYSVGDPFKQVNWKATAKSGELKTNLFDTATGRPVLIEFSKIDIRELEDKISAVSFTIIDLMAKKIPVGLRIGDRSFPPALSDSHRFGMMKELALYG